MTAALSGPVRRFGSRAGVGGLLSTGADSGRPAVRLTSPAHVTAQVIGEWREAGVKLTGSLPSCLDSAEEIPRAVLIYVNGLQTELHEIAALFFAN